MSINGIVVSAGIAFGKALTITNQLPPLDFKLLSIEQIDDQQQKLTQAIHQLIAHLQHCQHHLCPECDHFQLIDSDIILLEDEELQQQLHQHIHQFRVCAAVAVDRIFNQHAVEMSALDDPYLANRSIDIICLAKRLTSALHGHLQWDLSALTEDTILLADDLTPAEFAILPLTHITGLILESGGLTSHTAILARAAGIPALLNYQFSQTKDVIEDGAQLVLDGMSGELHVAPSTEVFEQLKQKQQQEVVRRQALMIYKDRPSQTRDGHQITLLANVGNLSEISHITDVGAQGIGLFRTEFLLMNAKALPDEQQQYKLYSDALHSLQGEVLTIRTFDIGADKEIPCLPQTNEDNPALGIRGIRYSLAHPATFITQIKAILRAANHGQVRLMFPMVSQVEELDAAFLLIERAKQELNQQEKGFGTLSYGIVVETPAAVFNLPSMLPMLDFVSIGTNDLTQYTLAADRTNPNLAKQYPPLSPAVIQLISMTVSHCKQAQVKVSLCGELGSDPQVLPLLVGLGLDELSINPANLLDVKVALIEGNYSHFVHHAQHITQLTRITDIRKAINAFAQDCV
ncbi:MULTISPECIES: phosphoenolpyruvate--protein phosphotransferase [Shewanella]|uniref:phosphoenolpyruvate--protein phosphotransferase n=1 Tax=Shewanella TaxID=22 RepID=UPI000C59D20F|nr:MULTISPECIES: phosphoenolpyruvate--protein phosphotransferase [Shewanella]NCQ43732.1 phosphoenolpyruvate--protein phosphotransferase [Shewanella frigidimarina]NCO70106.1 phosphoenolpyruvate--protein phosphotransferase [Shewanella vesiculosa]NCP35646.1 phosphoenolpyruvate--protein phosphotransferase [Shewanella vesiculosa]NCP68227.1 phosphoenolpyruvate--protein phosphotransferase [Shewanella vesiculosa]NCP72813.1 phosphoenolpyruvate--protein phosphotransferase [Shewanella vesiculosa]